MEALKARIRELEEKNVELSKNNEQLEREKKLNFDSRLLLFGKNVPRSHSYRSNSNHSESKENLRSKTRSAKENAKTTFTLGEKMSCVICSSTQSVNVAHIISSGLSDYRL